MFIYGINSASVQACHPESWAEMSKKKVFDVKLIRNVPLETNWNKICSKIKKKKAEKNVKQNKNTIK